MQANPMGLTCGSLLYFITHLLKGNAMSIKNNALLVSFACGKPQLTKKDDKATHDAESANNAHGAGQFRKDLYPKHLIAPISAVESSVRAFIDSTTYPWSRGEYLLPTLRFMAFMDRVAKYEIEFNQAVTAFLNNWSNVMVQAQQSQGALFDASVYPDLSTLRDEFRFRVSLRPVTDTTDFRVKLSEEQMELLREKVEAEVQESTSRTMAEPLKRLREHIERLREVAAKPDRTTINKRTGYEEVKAPIFRDSVVDNIIEEIKLLREFDEILPQAMLDLADEIHDAVPGPNALRDSPEVRKSAVTISTSLLASIDEMLGA
jgi:hypothetical protein